MPDLLITQQKMETILRLLKCFEFNRLRIQYILGQLGRLAWWHAQLVYALLIPHSSQRRSEEAPSIGHDHYSRLMSRVSFVLC